MSPPLKNVVVVGASGSLGAPVVKELLSQGFTVTALTRANSKSTFPADIVVKRVEDFSSVPALTTALQGQDAVVSAVAGEAIGDQKALADAAAAAGVRRFVPSEFGFNTRTMAEDSPDLFALLGGKTRFLDYLIEKVTQNEQFSWTGISTGSFVDWTLGNGLYGIDLAARTATIYDSGDNRFQVASLPFIGKAIASVLSHPEETKNKYLAIGANTSQNEILQILEQETAQKWKVEHAQTADLVTAGRAALQNGKHGEAFVPLFLRYAFGEEHSLKPEENKNSLLGLEQEDLTAVVGALVQSKASA